MRWVVILLALSGCAALTCCLPGAMASPGNLRKGHEQLSNACLPCHEPFGSTAQAKCETCHPLDQIGVAVASKREAPEGSDDGKPAKSKVVFHAYLSAQKCWPCHADHGREAADAKFTHALLKSDIRPKCATCHHLPKDAPHAYVVSTCDACHTTTEWSPATCDHRRYYSFDRRHDSTCTTCHPNGDHTKYTCYGCHEHSPARMRGEHREERITELDQCADCHRGRNMSEAKRIARAIRDRARTNQPVK